MPLKFARGDTIIVLHEHINRTYSLITEVKEIGHYEELEEPSIIIDERIAGEITKDDYIKIFKINVPIARHIELAISKNSSIYEGNWTPIINSQLKDQVCDIGDEISFTTPGKYANSGTTFAAGLVYRTIPPAPIRIGDKTTIHVYKKTDEELRNFEAKVIQQKKQRAESYLEELKRKIFNLLLKMKNDALKTYPIQYDFKTEANYFYQAVKQVMAQQKYYCYYKDQFSPKNITKTNDQKLFSGVLTYFTKKKNQPDKILDIQIHGKNDVTKMLLLVYASTKKEASKFYNQKLERVILRIAEPIATEIEPIAEKCPYCGHFLNEIFNKAISQPEKIAKTQPLLYTKGVIKCSCGVLLVLPLKYRRILSKKER
ncbi:MAG: hypothetical protein GF308_09990 [Candidatus Heimdallarchaeota archaeon]|nr:hypothetical protein [Candidatus Heimdallarchaeota archaeon]